MIITKCKICGKDIRNDGSRRNLRYICKGIYINGRHLISDCRREYNRQYKLKNRYKIREKDREWRRKKKIRIDNDLQTEELKIVQRICLKCDKTFPSSGKYNRLCVDCNRSNETIRLMEV